MVALLPACGRFTPCMRFAAFLIYNFSSLPHILLLLFLLSSPVMALSSFDRRTIDESFLEPPQIRNSKLQQRVNFSFKNTELADILLLLSRQAEFNVVLPDRFNKELSIQINNQRIVDAIDDIIELAGLSYRFRANSLIVTSKDSKGQFFTSIPVIHYSADKLAKTINKVFFANLIIAQDPSRMIPSAVADPSKNSVILFGDEEQVEAARKFIKQQDLPPQVKIYQPEYINLEDAEELVALFINSKNNLSLTNYANQDILIKGPAEELNALLDIFDKYDRVPKQIDIEIEIHAVEKHALDFYTSLNEHYKTGGLYLLSPVELKTDEFKSLFDCTEIIISDKFSISRDQPKQVSGIDISGERILFDHDRLDLQVFGQEFNALAKDKHILKLLGGSELKHFPEIEKLLFPSHADLVWVMIKVI